MKTAILFSIIFLSLWITPASADITWDKQCTIVIHPASNVTCGDVQINNIQFSAAVRGIKNIDGKIVPEINIIPSILFKVANESVILTSTDSTYIEQKNKMIKIDVSKFTASNSNLWIIESYNPQATLTVYKRQHPKVEISLVSDKSQYEQGQDENINITLLIKNTGTEILKPIKIQFIQSNLTLSTIRTSSQQDFEYCCIAPANTVSYTNNFYIPEASENKTHTVRVLVQLQDPEVSGKTIDYTASMQFNIIPQNKAGHVTVLKYIPDRFYTSDNVTVGIIVINQGAYSLYGVVVTDSNTLYPVNSSQELNWYIPEIKPDSQAEIRYPAYPVSSGSLTIPSAKINYSYLGQPYQASSNIMAITIINNPNVKIRGAPITATPSPTAKPDISSPATVVATPILTTTPTVQPTPQPTAYPMTIPGFEGVFIVLALLLIKR